MTRVADARAAAARWVTGHAAHAEGFRGAFFSGSATWLPDDAELPATSDVDVLIVMAQDEPPLKPGKFRYEGVLVEAGHLPWQLLSSAEKVADSYHLASALRTDTIIADPTGRLRELQERVARDFAAPDRVRRRCASARRLIEERLASIDASAPLHQQVTAWLFGTGVTTHVLLVAALRNPTVRLRYPAAREALSAYGLAGRYPELLELLGCAHLTPERVAHHVDALARTFDAAASVARTPFFFSADITPAARPVAIDGSRHLIDAGDHREAVFWIVATFARCQAILAADAPPDVRRAHRPAFEEVLADLGIASAADLPRRADEVTAYLPELWSLAETLV